MRLILEQLTLADLQSRLRQQRFSGVTLLHWQNGEMRLLEFPERRIGIVGIDKAVDVRAACRTNGLAT